MSSQEATRQEMTDGEPEPRPCVCCGRDVPRPTKPMLYQVTVSGVNWLMPMSHADFEAVERVADKAREMVGGLRPISIVRL